MIFFDNTIIYLLSLFVLTPILLFLNKKIYLIFSLLLLIPILFFRDYGPDYLDYKEFFLKPEVTLDYLNQGEIEPFWPIFLFINKKIFNSPQIGFTIIGLTSFLLRFKTVDLLFKSKYYQALSMSIYIFSDFFVRDLGQIRNGLAVSLMGLFSALYIYKRINLKAKILALLSVLIHYQSILIITLVLFFENTKFSLLKIKFKNLIILISIGFSLTMLIEPITNLCLKLPYIDKIASVVLVYLKSERYSAEFLGDSVTIPYFIILSGTIAFFSIILNRKKYPRKIENLLNLQILAPFTFIFLIPYPILSSRVSSTFTGLNNIFYPIIFYYILIRINKSSKQNVLILFTVSSTILGFFSLVKYASVYIK